MLTPAEFDLYWKAVMVVIEFVFAALLVWPFVTDYRRVCRDADERDDLMLIAALTEEIGPAWERIPRGTA